MSLPTSDFGTGSYPCWIALVLMFVVSRTHGEAPQPRLSRKRIAQRFCGSIPIGTTPQIYNRQ